MRVTDDDGPTVLIEATRTKAESPGYSTVAPSQSTADSRRSGAQFGGLTGVCLRRAGQSAVVMEWL